MSLKSGQNRRWRDRLKQPEGLPGYVDRMEEHLGDLADRREVRKIRHAADQERTAAAELGIFGGSRIALDVFRIAQLERAEAARSALLAELHLEVSEPVLHGWLRGLKRS